MYQAFENAIKWLLVSSSDSEQVSLTIRGLLVGFIPAIMFAAGFAHVNIGQDQLNELVNGIVSFIETLLTLIATAMTLFGLVRKLWNTALPKYAF
jgi:predicted histidine transporter YuiF (NhaC family)